MQGVNTGESGAPNGEQGMRTQEIHIVSSNAHRQAYVSMQNQRLQKQFEPMTFSNTPFPAEKEGHRRGKAESTPRWRFAFVASLIAIDLAVMLLSLTVSLVINGAAFDAIGDVMPFWLFLILFSLIWLLCLAFAGTYQRHVMADGYELYAKIINASLLTIICILQPCIYFQTCIAPYCVDYRASHRLLLGYHRTLADASSVASSPQQRLLQVQNGGHRIFRWHQQSLADHAQLHELGVRTSCCMPN